MTSDQVAREGLGTVRVVLEFGVWRLGAWSFMRNSREVGGLKCVEFRGVVRYLLVSLAYWFAVDGAFAIR